MNNNNMLPRLLIFALIVLALLAMPSGQASAALIRCRTDPKFYLSNGDKLTIVLDISAASSDILYADYVLHLPPGVTVQQVVYTAGGIGEYESYSVVNDGARDTYRAEVLVMVQRGSVPVIVTASSRQGQNLSFSGFSARQIPVMLRIGDRYRFR